MYADSSNSNGPTSKGSWCGTTAALARLGRPGQAGGGIGVQTHGGRPARLLRGPRIWGWAERPSRQLIFACDIPRLDRPLPRALAPDVDRDLMAAVAKLADPFARHGLAILRGTGMRLGELLDLELDCLWDSGDHGTWVKVPVGKLGTERTVPLDEDTLAAFDAWMAQRGPQRALTHPRHGQPADFLFVERGRRLAAYRLRHGSTTPSPRRADRAGRAKRCE